MPGALTALRLNLYYLGKNRSDDNEGYSAGNDWDTMRNANISPAPDIRAASSELGFYEFGSSHASGLNIVFVDGSVHFISFSIAPAVFVCLGTRADGKAVGTEDY